MSILNEAARQLTSCISAATASGDHAAVGVIASARQLILDGIRLHEQSERFVSRPERRACNFRAQLTCGGHMIPCRVVDISIRGLGIAVNTLAQINVGEHVVIGIDEVGEIRGILRWKKHQRLGVEIEMTGDSVRRCRRAFELLPAQDC